MELRSKLGKHFISVIVFAFLIIAAAVPALAVDVNLDGKKLEFNDDYGYPFIDGANRTQVPFRMTLEAFGCEVSWDSEARTAVAEKDGTVVKVPIGESFIYVNGEKVLNDTKAVIINSRTYLPIRAVMEAFGADVDWDGSSKTVIISSINGFNRGGEGNLKIYFIDVGQGDCSLIDFGKTEVLIDAGPKEAGDDVLSYLNEFVDGPLDYIIITHLDADHVGGFSTIISKYADNFGKVIYSGEDYKTMLEKNIPSMSELIEKISDKFVEDNDMTIDLGNGPTLRIIETGDEIKKDNNEISVITQVEYGKFKALFTGDMPYEVEGRNLEKFEDVDVLKVGHHGSRFSSSAAFLNVIKPENAIISYAKGNSFGHPHYLALERLISECKLVYGTGKSGTIFVETNGEIYDLYRYKNAWTRDSLLTLDDAGDMTNTNEVINPLPEGDYYLGNLTSKRLHFSSCENGSIMRKENRVEFGSREEAIKAGYIPCKVCCP